jgi:hypothetical protein
VGWPDFKSVSDFSALTELKRLQHLAVTGSMWSRQRIESLEPFASMTWLSSLTIDTLSIPSLRPLRLTILKELGVGGRLPSCRIRRVAGLRRSASCRAAGMVAASRDSASSEA